MMLTTATGILPVVPANVPTAMREADRWVCWKATPKTRKRDGTKYLDKEPRRPGAPRYRASSIDPKTWGSFQQAVDGVDVGGMSGIGFCLCQGWLGIDMDGVRDATTGIVEPAALTIVEKLATYTEVSPSGTGLKLFLRGEVPEGHKHQADGLDMEIYGGRNLSGTGRYFTVTGHHLAGTPTDVALMEGAREVEVMRLWGQLHAATRKNAKRQGAALESGATGQAPAFTDVSDDELVEVGHRICRGFPALWDGSDDAHGGDTSRADLALAGHLAFLCGAGQQARVRRLMRMSKRPRDKWEENAKYLERTIDKAYSDQADFYDWSRHATAAKRAEREAQAVAAVVRVAGQEGPGGPIDLAKSHTLDEVSCGRRLALNVRDRLRYVSQWKKWVAWDGTRWRVDDGGAALHAAKGLRDDLWRELANLPTELQTKSVMKFVRDVGQAKRLQAIVSLAAVEPALRVDAGQLDRHPFLLNVRNGVLDLKTLELRPHTPDLLLTQLANVDFDFNARSELWERFIREATGGDDELARFLQRSAGVALTGNVRDELLWCHYGRGANGKSTYLDALRQLMGDYAAVAPPSFLAIRHGEAHPTELASLHGKRLVAAIEMESGARMRESLVKSLTGGDAIQVRRMREDFWNLEPTWKLHISFNDAPRVSGTDDGIRRRLRIVPWRQSFTGSRRDSTLKERLTADGAERAGILAWCLSGLLAWGKDGIGEPEVVMASTDDFARGQDVLGQFIDESCELGTQFLMEFGQFHTEFLNWLKDRGEGHGSWNATRLGNELQRRNFLKLPRETRGKLRGKYLYRGLGLTSHRHLEEE